MKGTSTAADVLVRAAGLRKYFPLKEGRLGHKQYVKAVDDVSFDIRRGETFGLVGESGCGKSTLGRVLVSLYPLDRGRVVFDGQDLTALPRRKLKNFRKKMQFIFQDPSASLNPRITVGNILLEPFRIHRVGTREERREKITFLLDRVGLSSYHLSRYPHELSGGQKQRVGIARALALNPELIVCDEAVSALDVSIQAQVINLLSDLQREFALTYLFISHNLSVVHHVSSRIAVMYLGKLVEVGSQSDIYDHARHPYTEALHSAIPGNGVNRIILKGDVPSPFDPPPGCRFHTRCPQADSRCKTEDPPLTDTGNGHLVACHLRERIFGIR